MRSQSSISPSAKYFTKKIEKPLSFKLPFQHAMRLQSISTTKLSSSIGVSCPKVLQSALHFPIFLPYTRKHADLWSPFCSFTTLKQVRQLEHNIIITSAHKKEQQPDQPTTTR